MLVSEFNFRLPEELIAQGPLADRAASRLLHLGPGDLHDCSFHNFPSLLRPEDLLVFNNTRVFPARLYGRKSGEKASRPNANNATAKDYLQGRVEVLLIRQLSQDPNEWECLVNPGRRIGVGERLFFGDKDDLQAMVIARGDFGVRHIQFLPVPDFFGVIERLGHVPLPPYIDRPDQVIDRERYQTVYARERGSVAAPTAGLHFTPEVLEQIRSRGIETAEITLHVGLGTFQPVRVEKVEDHQLHRESYNISAQAAAQINEALVSDRRVVAVGTTTVRTLEHVAAQSDDGGVCAASGEADIFIYPGHTFRVVGAMLTNFHLPQSSLLMLVCALGGKARVMSAYQHAVEQKYRFYSYGDCMFVEINDQSDEEVGPI